MKEKPKEQKNGKVAIFFRYDRCWGDRIYGMFAALADVRNYGNIGHLPVRGLPSDAAASTLMLYGHEVADEAEFDWQCSKADAERWVVCGYSHYYEVNGRKYCSNPDWHTPSWCTTSEMEDCINRIFRNEDGTYKGDYSEWLALLGAMKGYEADGSKCRAVFWFDN